MVGAGGGRVGDGGGGWSKALRLAGNLLVANAHPANIHFHFSSF